MMNRKAVEPCIPEMARIESVEAGPDDHTLVVTWDDGARHRVDMTETVNRLPYFEPLLDSRVFRTVELAFDGHAIAWPGVELDYSADSLKALAMARLIG